MNKSVLIIKGYSKTATELSNDEKIIQLYVDFFSSNAGGVFEPTTEIFYLSEPSLEDLKKTTNLNSKDYLIVVLVGHGAHKDGSQIFQLKKDLFINPGQIQFSCPKQLHIIESCRNKIDFDLDIKRINKLIPKYKYGGWIKRPLTKQESLEKFNQAIESSNDGVAYLFACDIDEKAFNYYFLQLMVDVAIYAHEYFRNNIYYSSEIFDTTKKNVINATKGIQNPLKMGTGDFPFVITII